MDTKTFKALNGSIKKWERIVAGWSVGGGNCPLCESFERLNFCVGCPVTDAGFPRCVGSPWAKWVRHQCDRHEAVDETRIHCPTCLTLAKAELRFLKSLLPKEKK